MSGSEGNVHSAFTPRPSPFGQTSSEPYSASARSIQSNGSTALSSQVSASRGTPSPAYTWRYNLGSQASLRPIGTPSNLSSAIPQANVVHSGGTSRRYDSYSAAATAIPSIATPQHQNVTPNDTDFQAVPLARVGLLTSQLSHPRYNVPLDDMEQVLSTKVILDVGGQRFVTSRLTLAGSPVLYRLVTSALSPPSRDGAYFVDADPDLFQHILSYLRRRVFPIFYDAQKGHDHVMYRALKAEANYFQISTLDSWLSNQEYLRAVKVRETRRLIEGDLIYSPYDTTDNVTREVHWVTKKVYLCPRRIFCHRGKPEHCGKDCRRTQGDSSDEYEEELHPVMIELTRHVDLDPYEKICNSSELPT